MRISFIALALVFMGCATGAPAHARIDVVQSVPVETNLALPNVQDTASAWIELINQAKTSIDLEEFYIQVGDSLQPVLNAIQAATARGVKVRLLLDAGFYKTSPTDGNNFAKMANTEVRTVDFSKLGGIMHAKYFVVDHQLSYIGSANFDWLALSHIHEVGLKLNDAQIAAGLDSIFAMDWANGVVHAKKGPTSKPVQATPATQAATDTASSLLQLFASPTTDVPAGVSPTLPAMLNLMNNATNSIKIQVYEYATSSYGTTAKFKDLDNAIRAAASRGVKVQMLVDKMAMNAGSADLKALAKVANIEVRVITIPQWSGGPLQYARLVHSKYMLVDEKTAWIGSENWQGGYFTNTRNVGTMTNEGAILAKLGQIYNAVWNSGYTAAP